MSVCFFGIHELASLGLLPLCQDKGRGPADLERKESCISANTSFFLYPFLSS